MTEPEILAPGTVIAEKYRVEGRLGVGGMSAVYRAVHLGLEQPVALKVLLPKLAANAQFVARFLREAKSAAKLRGEHVGRVLDVGTWNADGAPYIALEYLEGEDLGKTLRARGTFEIAEAADYLVQACDGVARAHALGIIHRDLKPANLFLTRVDGEPLVKVIDFGVAKATVEEETQLTNTSEIFGSPQYMSPEQIRASKHVDARSDVWSLGCVLYEFLTGERAFAAPSLLSLTSVILNDAPRPVRKRRPDVPAELEVIVMKCLAKDPNERFPSAIDLAVALSPFGGSNRGVVESLRRLKVATEKAPPSVRSPQPIPVVMPTRRLSTKVMLITGAATFALVLLIAFVVDRALH